MSILDKIVHQKKLEVAALYGQYNLAALQEKAVATTRSFYGEVASTTAPF